MIHAHDGGPTPVIGGTDTVLHDRLTRELVRFNALATGADDRDGFTVRLADDAGGLLGGLAAWTWGGLCGIELLWVREDRRRHGWGTRILSTAETEARERGCRRIIVSSFTFQAPGFYQRHGYRETGRTPGFPAESENVHLAKPLTAEAVLRSRSW